MATPIACTLSSAEQRCHADELLPGLAALAAKRTVLSEGWRLEFTSTAGLLRRIADVVERERQCCTFLRFELVIASVDVPVVLTIDGPPGTGAFLAGLPAARVEP